MKTSLAPVVLVAVASSVATVGALELWRGPGSASEALAPGPQRAAPTADDGRAVEERLALPATGTAPPAASDGRTLDVVRALEERLALLEERLATVELEAADGRRSLAREAAERPPDDELRSQVLDWVAQERDERWQAEVLEEQEAEEREREFDARYTAYMLAREHGLERWQEDRLAELFLRVEERRAEVESSFDLRRDDPNLVEAQWIVFDEWAERLEREMTAEISPELYEELYGDEEDGDGG